MRRYYVSSLGVALALSMLVTKTRAEPPPQTRDPVARTRALLVKAIELVKKGRCPSALELLEEVAQRADSPDITYQQANCELQLGHYTRARKLSALALKDGPEGTVDNGDKTSAKVAAELTLQATDLNLGTLRLHIAPRGACVLIDGRALEVDPANSTVWLAGTAGPGIPCTLDTPNVKVLVDPGIHTVSISAPPRLPQSFEITIPSGATRSRSVALERDSIDTIYVHSLIVAGGAALAGSILGVVAIDRQRKSEKQCFKDRCTQAGYSYHQWAHDLGIGSTSMWVVAGSITGLGIVSRYLFAKSPQPSGTSVMAIPTPWGASFALRASF